ncbi:hypothetical protein JT359_04830 [Candidatus Poribacteria bacterium]|nr:hypothetical protein [Candidatus Poribacteria bacterium]
MTNQYVLCSFFICITVISSICFVGCDKPNLKDNTAEILVFNVDESKVESIFEDTELKIRFASPKGWKKVDESMVAQVVMAVDTSPMDGLEIIPRSIFLNEDSKAVCILSKIDWKGIVPDEKLLQSLTIAYQNQFPKANVKQGLFIKDAFRIHQLMVITSESVLIKLICDSSETLVFGVDYHVPIEVYKSELSAIESSIGSIDLIDNISKK